MNELLAAVLLIAGSVFCLVAAVGVLRLPDTLIRMHAATKAGTLGAGCILMAEALSAGNLDTTIKVIAIIVFLLLTAPVAAHLLGRAAYHRGIRLYKKTWIDELADTLKKVSSDEKKRDKEPG